MIPPESYSIRPPRSLVEEEKHTGTDFAIRGIDFAVRGIWLGTPSSEGDAKFHFAE